MISFVQLSVQQQDVVLQERSVFSLDVGSKVPSGGVFVIPAMSNPLAALIALLAGTAVTGVLLVLIKKKKTEEDEPMVDEKEEDLDLSGFTIS